MNTDLAQKVGPFSNLTVFNSNAILEEPCDCVSELPVEIGHMVFCFFGLRELSMASLTCKTWRVYAVNEMVARGKNKWSLVDSLLREGWVNPAFKVADTLPFCDPLYMTLFNQADMKNDFPLSLRIASYRDYNPRLIGQLAHCFNRNEKANWEVLIAWIKGLNLNNQEVFMTVRHLIGVIATNLAHAGSTDRILQLVAVSAEKDKRLLDSPELRNVANIMFDQGSFIGLLDLGISHSCMDASTTPLIATYLCNTSGYVQLEQWLKQVECDHLRLAKLMMNVVNCLCFKNKHREMTVLVDLLCKLKLLDRGNNLIRKINSEQFWGTIGRSIHHIFLAEVFIDRLNNLQAWEEGKMLVAFSEISLIHKGFLIEKIEIAQALRLSELDDEVAKQQQRIQSYFQEVQERKKVPALDEYTDDDEEFMAYLDQKEVEPGN